MASGRPSVAAGWSPHTLATCVALFPKTIAHGLHARCDYTRQEETHLSPASWAWAAQDTPSASSRLHRSGARGLESRATRITRPVWGQTRCIESRHGHSGFAATTLPLIGLKVMALGTSLAYWAILSWPGLSVAFSSIVDVWQGSKPPQSLFGG